MVHLRVPLGDLYDGFLQRMLQGLRGLGLRASGLGSIGAVGLWPCRSRRSRPCPASGTSGVFRFRV